MSSRSSAVSEQSADGPSPLPTHSHIPRRRRAFIHAAERTHRSDRYCLEHARAMECDVCEHLENCERTDRERGGIPRVCHRSTGNGMYSSTFVESRDALSPSPLISAVAALSPAPASRSAARPPHCVPCLRPSAVGDGLQPATGLEHLQRHEHAQHVLRALLPARPAPQSAVTCPFPAARCVHAPVSHAASRLPARTARPALCALLATLGRARTPSTSRWTG